MRRGDLVRIIAVPPGGFFQLLLSLPRQQRQGKSTYSDVLEPNDLCVVLQLEDVKRTQRHPGGVYAKVLTSRSHVGWISCKHIDVVARCNLEQNRSNIDT